MQAVAQPDNAPIWLRRFVVEGDVGLSGAVAFFQIGDRKCRDKLQLHRIVHEHHRRFLHDALVRIALLHRHRRAARRHIFLKAVALEIDLVRRDDAAPHDRRELRLAAIVFDLVLGEGPRIRINILNIDGKRRRLHHIDAPLAVDPAQAGARADVARAAFAADGRGDRDHGVDARVVIAIVAHLHVAVVDGCL